MSHHSLYFTRGTPRCSAPAFTLDFSQAQSLEIIAERLRQQYTYGTSTPPHLLDPGQVHDFSSRHPKGFEHKSREWTSQEEAVDDVSLVTPTFSKPKPIGMALGNGVAPTSSTATPPMVQRVPPPQTNTPADQTSRALTIKATAPFKEEPSAPNKNLAATTTEPPHVAPQNCGPIPRAPPTRPGTPGTPRPADLRRSVALLNANRSGMEEVQPPSTSTVPQNPSTQAARRSKRGSRAGSQNSMSSPDYRPSSPSSEASESPEPSLTALSIHSASPSRRRSARARAEPVTYNLKQLSLKALSADQENSLPDSPYQSERETASVVDLSTPLSASSRPASFSSSRPPLASRPSLPPRQHLPSRQTSHSRAYLQEFPDLVQTPREPRRKSNLAKLLWTREFQGPRASQDLVRATVSSNLRLWKSWKGASNDVDAVTFSPDGTRFAAGATALSDQYNRGNNLVYGDIPKNTLYELPDHNVPRKVNAAMADERLFPTVSTAQWVDQTLYTGSYDQTVKIWDTNNLRATGIPTCERTLRHDSGVLVMGVSTQMPHLIATGTTHSFHLWNLHDQSSNPQSLEIRRDPRQKANIILGPTVLGWGQAPASKRYVVGGMAEQLPDNEMDEKKRFQVLNHGHLGMWKVNESSIDLCRIRGADSQNIFDLKWHQSLPKFAIGSTYSQAMNLPLRSKSVVQIFDIESGDRAVVTGKCACAAADINEVTFCPMNSTYVTASCTDGSTYVWDIRFDPRPIHRLRHGPSVMTLNPSYATELTDFGVRVALWGTTMDQFYTGATDGYLKQWDIRRSAEDALVANTVHLNDGITSGAFSADKSQLLLGDFGGGVHLLTCENTDPNQASFHYQPAPEPASTEEPGIPIAKKLLESRKLILHPVFGPVQGPAYNGPYAAWARGLPKATPAVKIRETPLLGEYQARQFDGPPIYARLGLDTESRRDLECQFNLARARHARRGPTGVARKGRNDSPRKRKRDNLTEYGGIEKDQPRPGSVSPIRQRSPKKKKKKKKHHHRRSLHVITRLEESVIDLTMDSEPESEVVPMGETSVSTSDLNTAVDPAPVAVDDSSSHLETHKCPSSSLGAFEQPVASPERERSSLSPVIKVLDEDSEEDFEDYWWPENRHVDANLSPGDL
ncbi:hypothetical protein POX_a00864 [Penicillium oxalicum]|uniref:hypothetical protein n=1 Tax=Penicillium oxalicum TaxID=69781 RepID=UPI0020B8655E|nr:hypothetical protein POX_a00864 [Penicillium oxalicum]KAI2794272.1 hypothetical protein POX_a00864 [Penicillium oxalicum]